MISTAKTIIRSLSTLFLRLNLSRNIVHVLIVLMNLNLLETI